MRGSLLAGVFLALTGPLLAQVPDFGAAKEAPPLQVEWISGATEVAPGDSFAVGIQLNHAEGWHTYGKVLGEGIIGKPTKLIWDLPEGWTATEGAWPPVTKVVSTEGKDSEGYEGTVTLPATISVPEDAQVGGSVVLAITVDALICDPANCMPFKAEASAQVTIAETTTVDAEALELLADAGGSAGSGEASEATSSEGGAATEEPVAEKEATPWTTLVLYAFLGGLILNVMPCVFPVLGIKIMSVVKQAGEDRRQVLLHGLAYTLGTLVCFWALAIVMEVLRSSGENLGWGFQLQSSGFVYGLTLFLFIFGLNMFGLFEIGSSAVGVGQNLQAKSGVQGSFFSGLLAVVVATPCAAPFLAPALAYAVQLPLLPSLGFFSVIALGLASPYLVLSIFPAALKILPKPGAWMESFKQAMSFLLFGTVAFLAWTLAGMVDEVGLRSFLFAMVLVGMGCWIYGRWCLPHKSTKSRSLGAVAALLAILGGVAYGWPQPPKEEWAKWSRQEVNYLHGTEYRPVYVDFTARWCFTCQTNKAVYKNPEIQELIEKYDIALLKADWTNEDPEITERLQQLGKAAVPVNILYIPGQEEPVILDELDGILTVDLLKRTFAKLEQAS